MRGGELPVAFRVNRQRQADRFDGVVDIGVAPGQPGEIAMRFTLPRFGGVDEVKQFLPFPAGFDLPDAVRNPLDRQAAELILPEAADLDGLEVDGLEGFTQRLRRDQAGA